MPTPSQLAMALAPTAPQQHAAIGPTDVLGAYSLATNTAEQQYQAKLQQQNALWGGLAGLGGAGLTAYILKGGLFGKGTPAASDATGTAGAANATGTAGAANLTGPTQFAGTVGGAAAPVTPVTSSPLVAPTDFSSAGTPMLSGADMAAAMPANSVVGGDFGALGLAPNSVVASDFAGLPASASAFDAAALPSAGVLPAAGTVAADMAAAAPVAAEAASTAPAWGATLADLLPLLFGM